MQWWAQEGCEPASIHSGHTQTYNQGRPMTPYTSSKLGDALLPATEDKEEEEWKTGERGRRLWWWWRAQVEVEHRANQVRHVYINMCVTLCMYRHIIVAYQCSGRTICGR